MTVRFKNLCQLEYKLKTLRGFPEVYYYPNKIKHWAYVGAGLYIQQLDIIFIDNKIKKSSRCLNKCIIIYLILHELAHSTAHPKRLNRKYMKGCGFGENRSLTKYIREWDDFYKNDTSSDYDDTISNAREEILADKCAMSIYRWLDLPVNKHIMGYFNQRKYYQKQLKLKSCDYTRDKQDIEKECKKCVNYLKAKLKHLKN